MINKKLNIEEYDSSVSNQSFYDHPDMSYIGDISVFFNNYELQSKENLNEIKKDIVKLLSDKEKHNKISEFEKKLLIRKLMLIYLYFYYFDYFKERYGKKVYRFIGNRMDIDLENEKMIEKASEKEGLIEISHDGGFVHYWSFGDAILFRTIKKLKL